MTVVVDARGHRCPIPTLKLRRALESATQVTLLADDPLARIDVPHFAAQIGAEVTIREHEDCICFEVSRPTPLPEGEGGARRRRRREGEGVLAAADPRIARARELRRTSQDAEHKLWDALRARKLRGHKFRRQHPIANYVADFACVDRRVVVELDGPQHAEQTAYDARRTDDLQTLGWVVLRFPNHALDNDFSFDGVLAEIAAACQRADD